MSHSDECYDILIENINTQNTPLHEFRLCFTTSPPPPPPLTLRCLLVNWTSQPIPVFWSRQSHWIWDYPSKASSLACLVYARLACLPLWNWMWPSMCASSSWPIKICFLHHWVIRVQELGREHTNTCTTIKLFCAVIVANLADDLDYYLNGKLLHSDNLWVGVSPAHTSVQFHCWFISALRPLLDLRSTIRPTIQTDSSSWRPLGVCC